MVRKTHETFLKEVTELVGDSYTVLGDYSYSNVRLLIRHEDCGNEYEITPSHFLSGRRCKRCTHRKTQEQFDIEVESALGIEYVVTSKYEGMLSKVQVKHLPCGYEYEAYANNLTRGFGCRKCGRVTASEKLTKSHDTFIREVSDIFGDEYTVLSEYEGAHKHVDMIHNDCGNIYKVSPTSVLSGRRCSHCAGNRLRDTDSFKEIVFEKESTNYTVLSEYVSSHELIVMKHESCSNEYPVRPAAFIRGARCPHCCGTRKKTTQEFEKEINELTNNGYSVLSEYVNNRHDIKLKHLRCGNIFDVTPYSFLKGTRCNLCNSSMGEARVSEVLKNLGISFDTQYRTEECVDIRKLPFDFVIYKSNKISCLIEYDGGQHFKAVDLFGGEEGFRDRQRKDAIKTQYCADNGIPLIRIPYWDYDNIDAILTEKLLPLLKDADKHNAG